MAQVTLISPQTKQAVKKLRVAAYCRVSTNSADQLNSYARQVKVYTEKMSIDDVPEEHREATQAVVDAKIARFGAYRS
jgi:predicted site-specific integrase-resolvase